MSQITLSRDFNKALEKKLGKLLKKAQAPKEMKENAEFAIETIKTRTRLGKGVSRDGGAEGKFAPLATSTKIQRATAKKRRTPKRKQPTSLPELSPLTSPGKSNLTWTGEMLDNIGIIAVRFGEVVIGFLSRDKEKIASYHESGGSNLPRRPFFHLSFKDKRKINQFIQRKIRRFLRTI